MFYSHYHRFLVTVVHFSTARQVVHFCSAVYSKDEPKQGRKENVILLIFSVFLRSITATHQSAIALPRDEEQDRHLYTPAMRPFSSNTKYLKL